MDDSGEIGSDDADDDDDDDDEDDYGEESVSYYNQVIYKFVVRKFYSSRR